MLTIIHFGEATCIKEGLEELDREGRVAVVDIADINRVLNSCFFVYQFEQLKSHEQMVYLLS